MSKQSLLILLTVAIAALVAAIFLLKFFSSTPVAPVVEEEVNETEATTVNWPEIQTVGQSVEGRSIEYYEFGTGENHLLFVGGIHGGYEWNSSLLAWQFIDYLTVNPDEVPSDVTIGVIPSLNPDGLAMVTGKDGRFTQNDITSPATRIAEGRMNANGVDLNRNFACKWQPESTWRGNVVSAGTAPFSEPEAATLRDLVAETQPTAVVFWHSQANNVYASECESGVLPDTLTLMETYATAGKYGAVPSFDAYPITGDAEGWLASLGIPAVTVELESYQDIEWQRNIDGVTAVIDTYSKVAK